METYLTNHYPHCPWTQVHYHRKQRNGDYTPKTKWKWLDVNAVNRWFMHKARQKVFDRQRHSGVLSFRTTACFSAQDKESPQIGNFVLEFDAKSDDDYPLMVNSIDFIRDEFFGGFHLPETAFRYWFSGGRSFHLEIPYQFFGIEPTVHLNLYWKFVAKLINNQLPKDGFPLDAAIYSNPRVFRLPNSFNPHHGRYKIELKPEELALPIDTIRELARNPRPSLVNARWGITDEQLFSSYTPVSAATDWWNTEVVPMVTALQTKREGIAVNIDALKAMTEAPLCIKRLRSNGPADIPKTDHDGNIERDENGDPIMEQAPRNECQILDATYSLHHGETKAEAIALIDDWTDRMEGTPSKKKRRRDSTRSCVESVYEENYRFYCNFARRLGLVSISECQTCPLFNAHDRRKHQQRVRNTSNSRYDPTPQPTISIETARQRIEFDLNDYVQSHWAENPTTTALALLSPPGSGKTTTAIKTFIDSESTHLIYTSPLRANLNEQCETFPALFKVHPRASQDPSLSPEDQLCIQPDICDAIASKRYSTVQLVCLGECARGWNTCPYKEQFCPRHTAATHDYLFSVYFVRLLTTGEHPSTDDNPMWVTLFDEPSIGAFLEPLNLTNQILTDAMNKTPHDATRQVLDICRHTVETIINGKPNPPRRFAYRAFSAIDEAATKLGHDLSRLLIDAEAELAEEPPALVPVETDDENDGETEWMLNFQKDLIAALATDSKKQGTFNSPLAILRYEGQPTLRLNIKKTLTHLSGPLAFLDGCMRPELLSALAERPVETLNYPISMKSKHIVQITDGYYGITTLWDKTGAVQNRAKGLKPTAKRLLHTVERIAHHHPGKNVLLVTWKRPADELRAIQQKHLEGIATDETIPANITVAHYGALEGLNQFQDHDAVILLGTPSVSEDDIVEWGHAIWANDPQPLNTAVEYVWKDYAYRANDGSGVEAMVREFADERLNLILRTHREDEMVQAVHRIRPLLHEGKTIYLLSNLPIDELPPTQLLTLDQLNAQLTPESEEKHLTDFDKFKGFIEKWVDTHSGVWSKAVEKIGNLMLVVDINIYYKGEIAKILNRRSTQTINRWFGKAALELDFDAKTLVFGQNVRLKVWHRPGELDENRIRSLYEQLNPVNEKPETAYQADDELTSLLDDCSAGWCESVDAGLERGVEQSIVIEATRLWLADDYEHAETLLCADLTPDYVYVDTPQALAEAIEPYQSASVIALDTETTGLDPLTDRIRLIQLATEGHPPLIVDLFAIEHHDDLNPLAEVLRGTAIKVFHNAKFDIEMLTQAGFEVGGHRFDTMLAAQLLQAGESKSEASLAAVVKRYLGEDLSKSEQTSDWSGDLTRSQLLYAAKDTNVLLRTHSVLTAELVKAKLDTVAQIEFDCINAVAEMELKGMRWDIERLDIYRQSVELRRTALASELYVMFGAAINLDSHVQVKAALERLTGQTIKSTRASSLIPLRDAVPAIPPLLEYKTLSTLSGFLKKYPQCVHSKTGRIHASYWQAGSVAGRFSCSQPNLQQVPRDAEVRGCVIPAFGHKLIIADYSQIELRVLAEISGDTRMIDAYQRGEDLHRLTASLVQEIPIEAVTKEQRHAAKAVNFGLIYGMGARGLLDYAKNTFGVEMSMEEATRFRQRYFDAYDGVKRWHNDLKRQTLRESRTLYGRRRLWDKPPPLTLRYNTPVQGTAADMIKQALGMLPDKLVGTGAKIIGMVHDEILLEALETNAEAIALILTAVMESAGSGFLHKVPVVAEARIANSWAEK